MTSNWEAVNYINNHTHGPLKLLQRGILHKKADAWEMVMQVLKDAEKCFIYNKSLACHPGFIWGIPNWCIIIFWKTETANLASTNNCVHTFQTDFIIILLHEKHL